MDKVQIRNRVNEFMHKPCCHKAVPVAVNRFLVTLQHVEPQSELLMSGRVQDEEQNEAQNFSAVSFFLRV